MAKSRRILKDSHKSKVLETAQLVVTAQMADQQHTDLSRVGVVWSGILDLEGPIPPSEVAAMLSAYDLVRATTLVDAHEHWVSAAAYAAIADATEPVHVKELAVLEDEKPKSSESATIGFVASRRNEE
jgi:hypothetical protein